MTSTTYIMITCQISHGERGLSGFYLGFFVWGGLDLEKKLEPRGGEKKMFLRLLGGPGACSLGKF